MVKAIRIPDREGRRRHRLEQRERSHHRRLLKLATFSPSPPSHQQQQQLQGEDTQPNSATTQETATVQKSPATPKCLSAVIRRKRMTMKRSRSVRSPLSSSSRYSPSPSSSYYSPLSLSCSSSSSPSISLSPLQIFAQSVAGSSSFSNPSSPELSSQPPLLPRPSPELLRRTVSDPVQLMPHSTSLTPQKSALRSVSRNLTGQLPPLPPSESSPSKQQQHLLRRTISDPVPMASPDFQQEKLKGKMKDQEVEAEKLSGEWFVVKFNCECGKDNHYLVNASDKKYFKLLQ